MRWGRAILGVLLVVIGTVWLLQGRGALPGSFMAGSSFWTVVGACLELLGLVLLASLARR